jgi:hypothetical protein
MTGLRPETLLAQAAGADDPTTGGVIPPLQPSTTFLHDPGNVYRRGFDHACDPTYAPADAWAGVPCGRMAPDQVVRLLQDVAAACDVVGPAIAEYIPWEAITTRDVLRKLPLLAD